jgi:hypothetical protein
MLQQTLSKFELIIIDDCSTDSSNAIVRSYNDPRIRLYRNDENKGISYSLNKGIELATTDWIVRMDSDDISYPNRLERQFDFIQKNKDGALYSCGVRVVDEEGRPLRTDRFDSSHYFYNLNFLCIIYHPTVIMRKDALLEVGGYTVPYAEDFELFWQLSRKHKIYHQDQVLLDYRQTGQSLHQVVRKKEYLDAQLEQLLRNIRAVTHRQLQVPESHLHCLQHYFEPIEQEGNVQSIAACLRTLDQVSAGIARQPNPNNDPATTLEAAAKKRRFILEHFMRNLPLLKATTLLVLLGEWSYLFNRLASRFQRNPQQTILAKMQNLNA